MNKRPLHVKGGLGFLAMTTFFCLNQPAAAQSTPAQPAQNDRVQDRDTTRDDLANFDRFLDGHREIAGQLRKDPSLLNNDEFVKNHPALQTYLQDHPTIRDEIRENPNSFMRQENRFDRQEANRQQGDRDTTRQQGDRDTTRQELGNFDRFLDSHHETAEALHKDPSLINNQEFVKNHPALQTYLQDHPAVREEIRENPNSFMQAENRLDHQEANRQQGDRDTTRQELANFDRFLDSHRETGEALHKDPSLINNQEFVKNHPALQTYLQDHPAVREEIRENPNSFMQAENRFDHQEANRQQGDRDATRQQGDRDATRQQANDDNHRDDQMDRNRSMDRDRGLDRDTMHRQFGEFLGSHSDLAERLSKDPSLVKNQEFVESHPELKEYLNAHPDARQELMANPQNFIKSAQPSTTKTPTVQPKPPKQ